jgi:adenine specific DNA methylase Mod
VQTDYIERLFRQANTLQLLREPNATLVLSFLKQAFSNGRKSIGQDALTQLLIDFLQNIAEQDAFSDADETQISADLFDRYRNRARNLLRDDGVIFISIDDNEAANLKLLCDEVFGAENFITTICHKARASVSNDKVISSNHNFILLYGNIKLIL